MRVIVESETFQSNVYRSASLIKGDILMRTWLYQLIRTKQNVVALCCTALLLPFLIATTRLSFPIFTPTFFAVTPPKTTTLIDLAKVQKTIALKGSLAAYGSNDAVQELVFTIRNIAENKPLSLANSDFVINYRDPYQRISNVKWSPQFQSKHSNDQWLQSGESLEIRIPVAGLLKHPLGANTPFVVDMVAPQGIILRLERTTPSQLGSVLNLS
jgi:hypothetical protein